MSEHAISNFYLKRRSFIIKSVLLSSVIWLGVSTLASDFSSKYRIGLDLNEVKCLPWTAYVVKFGRGPFYKGDYVAFKSMHGLMGARFEGKLIGKQVGAVAGDHVLVKDDVLIINDKVVGALSPDILSKLGVAHRHFDRDVIVPEGRLLALGTDPRSYDGRYWGWLNTSDVIGWIQPIY